MKKSATKGINVMPMAPVGISQNALAHAIEVPPNRINEILHGKRVISADTALRLARYFSNTPGFWMNLQSHYEIECAKEGAVAESSSGCCHPDVNHVGSYNVNTYKMFEL